MCFAIIITKREVYSRANARARVFDSHLCADGGQREREKEKRREWATANK